MSKDDLGDRMKNYETVQNTNLMNKTPVIIRLDGKSFHTFTKRIGAFNDDLSYIMEMTLKFLCENVQNCKLGYTQSDEISLLLYDNNKVNTVPWFGNNIQKMTSISSSLCTAKFNEVYNEVIGKQIDCSGIYDYLFCDWDEYNKALAELEKTIFKKQLAFFDSRAFNLPEHEIVNYFIWRQNDCSKNSISMLARKYFSHKSLQGLSSKQMIDKIYNETEEKIKWSDLETKYKHGTFCYKDENSKFIIDKECPLITKDRKYIVSKYQQVIK